uniref:Lysine-rich arabinogalactan protein 19-like n=1 Tax=Steinernema glaseri TaxID=37863 RepID=A0A1I7ZSI8_9BILA
MTSQVTVFVTAALVVICHAQQPTLPTLAPGGLLITTMRPPLLPISPMPMNTVLPGQGIPNPAQPIQRPMVTPATVTGQTSPPLTGDISLPPLANISLTIAPPTLPSLPGPPLPTMAPIGGSSTTAGIFGVTTMSPPTTLTPHRGEESNGNPNASSPLPPLGASQTPTTPLPMQTTTKGTTTSHLAVGLVLMSVAVFFK